jgi:hypothetical protein
MYNNSTDSHDAVKCSADSADGYSVFEQIHTVTATSTASATFKICGEDRQPHSRHTISGMYAHTQPSNTCSSYALPSTVQLMSMTAIHCFSSALAPDNASLQLLGQILWK